MTKKFTIFSLLLIGSAAQAQTTQQVNFVLSQTLVKRSTVNGKVELEFVANPKTVMPGDELREEVTLTNVSGTNLSRVLVSVPVPNATEFAGGATATNARWTLQYSIDGGKIYTEIPSRAVTVTENGKTITKQVPVPQNVYTHVRWTVANLKPDESLKLSFRVRVK